MFFNFENNNNSVLCVCCIDMSIVNSRPINAMKDNQNIKIERKNLPNTFR